MVIFHSYVKLPEGNTIQSPTVMIQYGLVQGNVHHRGGVPADLPSQMRE